MTSSILVFGRTGQVARELHKLGPPHGLELVFAGRETLDLSQEPDIPGFIAARAPAAVINAAAYTAVDKAESEPDAARRLNRDAPAAMARACAAQDIPLVHFSTDYVFDGTKPAPYLEDDPVAPVSAYGRSKAEGEAAVTAAGGRAAILRSSWLYSAFGANFIKTMLRLAETREEVRVVDDQVGRPTWAEDCARGALRAAGALLDRDAGAQGIFHLAGAGDASWADLAEAVFQQSAARGGPQARVIRIPTRDYPTPARRPANSRLDTGKISNALGVAARPWRDSLAACMDELGAARP